MKLPLTAAQAGIWMGQQLDLWNPAYWTAEAVELIGELDTVAFVQAVQMAVNDAEALHMRYHADSEGLWQETGNGSASWQGIVDVSAHGKHAWERAQEWMCAQLQTPADLVRGPVFSSALLRLGATRHLWFARAHHIALDGFGHALLARRVASLYSAIVQGLAPGAPFARFAPVVEDELRWLASPAAEVAARFWHSRLKGAVTPPVLAPLRPFGAEVTRLRTETGAETLKRWQMAARHAGVDWSAWCLAVVAAWVYGETGARDFCLGVPVMGRLGSVALNVPCMHMNIVPLRVHIDPALPLAALARQVAQEWQALRPHQRYRHEQMRRDAGLVGDTGRLFGPVVNLMPFDRPPAFAALQAISHPVSAGPVEDIAIGIVPHAGGLRLDLEGNGLGHDEAGLARLQRHLSHAFDLALTQPALPLADWQDGDGRLAKAPAYRLSGPAFDRPVVQVLAAWLQQANATPDACAVQDARGAGLTFGALLARVEGMAQTLTERGVIPGDRVVVEVGRSIEALVAMLAVMHIAAVWVPMDPAVAPERRENLLACLDHPWIIGASDPALQAVAAAGAMSSRVTPGAGEVAYILFTSGSSGTPKGVEISHAALSHYVAAASCRFDMSAADRMLQFAPLHFDACIEEIFLALCNGATLVLRDEDMLASMPAFLQAVEHLAISVLDLPTAFWHELVHALHGGQAKLPACVRLVVIGGEAAAVPAVRQWRACVDPRVTLLNTYGPTETTVVCLAATLAGEASVYNAEAEVPIGTPLAGLEVFLLTQEGALPAPGEDAELCVAGPTLANGYVGQAVQSDQAFVTRVVDGQARRMYRTGDRVSLGADGQLYFRGRLDDEFKISGQRVAPREVELALAECPGVMDVAVAGYAREDGFRQLLAFVVMATEPAPTEVAGLRQWLSRRLPAACVPGLFIPVAQLPCNANGKTDRRRLLAQWLASRPGAVVPGRDNAQGELWNLAASIWCQVLGIEQVNEGDDFFDLGGKSLQAIQMVNRLGVCLQRTLPVARLFGQSRFADFVAAVAANDLNVAGLSSDQDALAPRVLLQGGRGLPLFCVHPADGLCSSYLGLLRHLPDLPVYGLQAPGLRLNAVPEAAGADFEAALDHYLAQIREVQPRGPYRLLGWSSGGAIAQALAVRLQRAGESVGLLALMDAYPAECWESRPLPQWRDALLMWLDDLSEALNPDGQPLDDETLFAVLRRPGKSLSVFAPDQAHHLVSATLRGMQQFRAARHARYEGDMLFFRAAERLAGQPEWSSWRPHVSGDISVFDIPGNHFTQHLPAALDCIGPRLREALQARVTATSHL